MGLASCGWEEGDFILTRFSVQVFAWSIVPRKLLAPVDVQASALAAFADFLERLPDPAPAYAEICRSDETLRLLREWDEDPAAATEHLEELMKASGLDPPDTDLLDWGEVMGPLETQVRIDAGIALERAIEAGTVTAGDESAAAGVTDRLLLSPIGPMTRLYAVETERIEAWAEQGSWDGPVRKRLLDRVMPLVLMPPPIDDAVAAEGLEPLSWVLGRAEEGIKLTATGALSRAFVREAADRYEGWYEQELFGPPHREDDVVPLAEIDELLRAERLVRRRSGVLRASKRGRELATEPAELLRVLSVRALAGRTFEACGAELAAAILLSGGELAFGEAESDGEVAEALSEMGWQSEDGEAVGAGDARWAVSSFIHSARSLGLAEPVTGETGEAGSRYRFRVTEAGKQALPHALRARAVARRAR